MTKKQEQLYICRMGHTLTEGIEFCRDEDCRHYKCDASKYPPEDSNCVFCIPVEPEPHIKHPEHQEGSRQHVISYSTQGRHCSEPNCEINFEPQPATCPDCGHLDIAHTYADGCRECECAKTPNEVRAKTPSELQPKHCTSPESQEICLLVGEPSEEHCEGCVSWRDREQPTPTMPLREQTVVIPPSLLADFVIKEIELEVCGMYYELAIGNKDDCRCDENGPCTGVSEVMDRLKPKIVQAITTSQQAHDSEVASKAVKEFAEKVIATMPNFSKEGDWSHIITENEKLLAEILRIGARYQYNKSVAHIRAMAEGKE